MQKKRNRLKTAVVLTGGGSRGAVEAGAMSVIDRRIKPDIIIGTSVGAINAAYYAAGVDVEEGKRLWRTITSRMVFPINWQVFSLSGKVRSLSHQYRLKRFLERKLPVKTFEECKIPLYINATELVTGKPVFFWSGNIVDAILASSAIPPYYPPWSIGGKFYIDGGISNVLALEAARNLGCKQVIAVSTYAEAEHSQLWNVFQLTSHALNLVMRSKFENEVEIESRGMSAKRIIIINPKIPANISITDFRHTDELIRLGEEEAERALRRA
jgi:NTE family protein